MSVPGGVIAATIAIARRPRLWPAATRAFLSLVPRRWWRQRPYLPLPDPDWVAFRMTTAYGDPSARIDTSDLIVWLEWSGTVRPRTHRRLGGEISPPGIPPAG